MYPGRVPSGSYLVGDGLVRPMSHAGMATAGLLDGRTAVLAVGSNAAPARLVEKCGSGAVIPVAAVRVLGHVPVYSAHIARYGAIAATLHPEPGASSVLHVTFLDDFQLAQVDATEGNYDRPFLAPEVIPELRVPVSRYQSKWGPLLRDGRPVRLCAFEAESELPCTDQPTILEYVAMRVGVPDAAALVRSVRARELPQSVVRAVLAEA